MVKSEEYTAKHGPSPVVATVGKFPDECLLIRNFAVENIWCSCIKVCWLWDHTIFTVFSVILFWVEFWN